MNKQSMTGGFFGKINELWDAPENNLSAFVGENKEWAKKYMSRNIVKLVEIDELQREINLIFDKMGVESHALFFKTYSIESLTISVKYYLISWSTMKDLFAELINSVFDLGIHHKDVNFTMALRNQKVCATNIPKIIGKYEKTINVGETNSKRNDIVHRGKLSDEKILELKKKGARISADRFSLLTPNKISDEEYKSRMNEFNKELAELVRRKKEEYFEHYDNTLKLNMELVEELATIFVNYLSGKNI